MKTVGILTFFSHETMLRGFSEITFIILTRECQLSEGVSETVIADSIYDTSRMIGDVNLFFKGAVEDEYYEVEAEAMIAGMHAHLSQYTVLKVDFPDRLEKSYRRKGYASEALQLLLSFATTFEYPPYLPAPADKHVVRIGDKNSASIALFTKLGFEVIRHVEVFGELEMRISRTNKGLDWKAGTLIKLE